MASILVAVVVLAACATASKPQNHVTNGHLHDLRLELVGRQMEFLSDWTSYSVVYKGRPVHWFDMFHYDTPHVRNERARVGELQAREGERARITDVRVWNYHALALYFKTEAGELGVLRIGTPNREVFASEFWVELTNQIATIDWIEQQLRGTVTFTDTNRLTSPPPPQTPPQEQEAPAAPAQSEEDEEAFWESI